MSQLALLDVAPVLGPDATISTPTDEKDFKIKRPCKTFDGAFFCGMEYDEWNLVRGLVRPGSVVLELGGRFGTTSCVIAEKVGATGRVVAVEPDPKAYRALTRNRARHNCTFDILRATIGDTPNLVISQDLQHYATRTYIAHSKRDLQRAVPAIDYRSLEKQIGRQFDTLLIDCEGCIEQFFVGSTRRLLHQLRLILMEEDVPHAVDYAKWHAKLRHHGFERVWRIRDTFEPSAAWSRNISHSAWMRGGLSASGLPTCAEFAAQTRQSRRWLHCMDPLSEEPMLP